VLSWPKMCKLAHAFLWVYRYKRLKLAQLLGQLGVFLTWCGSDSASSSSSSSQQPLWWPGGRAQTKACCQRLARTCSAPGARSDPLSHGQGEGHTSTPWLGCRQHLWETAWRRVQSGLG
jgi:hypothetical protein